MQYSTVTTGVVALSTLWGLVSGIGIGNWSGPTGVVSGDWTSTSIPSSWMPTNTKSGNWSRPTGVMSGNWSLPTGSPLPPGLLPPENMTAPANMAGLLCCPVAGRNFTPQNITDILAGADKAISDSFTFPAFSTVSGGHCYTAENTNNASIILCNDNYTYGFVDLYDVATYAQWIAHSCEQDGNVCGQMFSTAGWNVIVDKYTGLIAPYTI